MAKKCKCRRDAELKHKEFLARQGAPNVIDAWYYYIVECECPIRCRYCADRHIDIDGRIGI